MNNDVRAIDLMPSDEYHRQSGVSNSMLNEFIESPELYHGRYVAETIAAKAPTPAMQFGSLFHDSVLLGIDHVAVEIPPESLSSNGSKTGAGWKHFQAHYAGMNKVFLKPDEFAALRNMVDAVWSHPMAARLLERADAAIEQSIFWADEETGLSLRSRLDHRKLSTPIITDLKSTADVSRKGFASSMWDYGYYRQVVFYREAAKALTGQVHDFVFVAVEKEPPHRVRCYELDPREDRAMTRGYEDVRDGLNRLAEAYRTNNWTEPGWDQVLTLDLPNWAYSNQWELTNGYGD